MIKLQIKNIHKSFGEQKVLQGIDMIIESGKIYTIVGENGTGKTTLFDLITGFIKPDSGEIWYNKNRLDKKSPRLINANGITRTFQDLRIINRLTVRENILLSFKNNPGDKIGNAIFPKRIFQKQYNDFDKKVKEILKKLHLKEVEDSLAGEISFGQQKLLTIGCCLANDADLLLLDEPVAGIDINNYSRISDLIGKLKVEGKTIMQIEHNHNFVKDLSDTIWFLNAGKATAFNNYNAFINAPIVKETYLN